MKRIAVAAVMLIVGALLGACQGLNSYQAYTGPCTYRAADHGFCQEPSNFHISDALLDNRP